MTTKELIEQKLSNFPPNLQQEVLDFVEFLENKLITNTEEDDGWEIFLSLEKDAPSSQSTDISTHLDQYLYQKGLC